MFASLFLHQGPKLHSKYHVKSFPMTGRSLETPVDPHLYNLVKNGLVDLLGARSYFGSKVLTPYCYTLGNAQREIYILSVSYGVSSKGVTQVFVFFAQMWR